MRGETTEIDGELVATLRLLFMSHGQAAISAAVHEAKVLPEQEQRRLVCAECGSDNLSFDGPCVWDKTRGEMAQGDLERCWCEDCSNETSDLEVAFDYVHPNKEAAA